MAQVNSRIHGIQELIWQLESASASEINSGDICHILENCEIPTSEWSKYAFYNKSLKFSRNSIYDVQGKFRLVLICWRPLQGNELHDHNESDCYFKVLQGKIHEQCINNGALNTDNHYGRGQMCYMRKSGGSHRMENPDGSDIAVTLHLYIPPLDKCKVSRMEDGNGQVEELQLVSRYGYAINQDSILL